jgi:hypothetical protein
MKNQHQLTSAANLFAIAFALCATNNFAQAGVSYTDPVGGWRYEYNGTFGDSVSGLPPGYGDSSQRLALDGTWQHDQASKWDGSGIGDTQNPGNQTTQKSPGGVSALTEGGTSFLRLQDAGNPEAAQWGFVQGTNRPINSNRRLYFGHKITGDGPLDSQLVMDNGITLSFRARIPNPETTVLDPIYPDPNDTITGLAGATTPVPWSTAGGGYPINDGGRGMFNVVQNNPNFFNLDSGLGFSLFTSKDRDRYAPSSPVLGGPGSGGLIMNNLNGNTPTGDVDTFSGGSLNLLPITDQQLYKWNEFWITIQADTTGTGTHTVNVYLNGSTTPTTFTVTATSDNQMEYKDNAWIAMGLSSTNLFGAVDVDFFSYSLGVLAPVSATLLGDLNRDGHVDSLDLPAMLKALTDLAGYESANSLNDDDLLAIGDLNHDNKITNADIQGLIGILSGAGSIAAVPEPASFTLAGLAFVGFSLKTLRRRATGILAVIATLVCALSTTAFGQTPASSIPQVIQIDKQTDIQPLIDAAPPHSTIIFNPNEQLVLSTPLVITKPLTLRGLNAKLPNELGRSSIVLVKAEGVTVEDFELHGNTESVEQSQRAALIRIEAGDFRVRHGVVIDASKHGVAVIPSKETGDIVGGVIRDIVGRRNSRCVVGIGDNGNEGVAVKNVVVENIRCYDGRLRGAVNIKDGNDNITVRDIYSENSVYAVDVQDHKKPGEVNRNIVIENVYAKNCRHAVRSNNDPLGHENLTIRNVTAVECAIPLRISNTKHVTLENIRVLDHKVGEEPYPPILVSNCDGLVIRDVVVKNSNFVGPGISIVDSNDVSIDGVTIQDESGSLTSGLKFLLTSDKPARGLRISHVSAPHFKDGGIVLESKAAGKNLSEYIISENLADVVDHIQGNNLLVTDNVMPR